VAITAPIIEGEEGGAFFFFFEGRGRIYLAIEFEKGWLRWFAVGREPPARGYRRRRRPRGGMNMAARKPTTRIQSGREKAGRSSSRVTIHPPFGTLGVEKGVLEEARKGHSAPTNGGGEKKNKSGWAARGPHVKRTGCVRHS